jgi:Regulator of chromosome condensation (RCC1) repeat
VLTFGRGSHGRLGHGHLQPKGHQAHVNNLYKPAVVDYLRVTDTRVSRVACGASHTLVLLEKLDGSEPDRKRTMLFSFGRNTLGQCGSPDRSADCWIPYLIGSLLNEELTDVTAGRSHSVAVSATGEAFVFGDNSRGQCGVVDPSAVEKPSKSSGLSSQFTQILLPTKSRTGRFVHSVKSGGDCTFFVCSESPVGQKLPSAGPSSAELAESLAAKREDGTISKAELLQVFDLLRSPPEAAAPAPREVYVVGCISTTKVLRTPHKVPLANPESAVIVCEKTHTAILCDIPASSVGEAGTSFARSSQKSPEFLEAEFTVQREFLLPSSEFLVSAHECAVVFNDICFPGSTRLCCSCAGVCSFAVVMLAKSRSLSPSFVCVLATSVLPRALFRVHGENFARFWRRGFRGENCSGRCFDDSPRTRFERVYG